jgi:hypothetical protein
MTELEWEPAAVGRLTLTQLVCLTSRRSPDDRRITSGTEWQDYLDRQQSEAEEWASCPN